MLMLIAKPLNTRVIGYLPTLIGGQTNEREPPHETATIGDMRHDKQTKKQKAGSEIYPDALLDIAEPRLWEVPTRRDIWGHS